MLLSNILPRLSGVRKGGSGYYAKCPSHQDNHQSLAIAEGDGRILLNCFAGCTADAIVSQLGLRWKDLFDKSITKPSHSSLGEQYNPPKVAKGFAYFAEPGRKIQNVYQYVDEKGQMLYENVRYYPKDFRQRHFDTRGAAVWNLDGVPRVPYRLPQLLPAIRKEADVFLTEGEKDCDALRELGLTVSNFKNWIPEFNKYIRESHVIIVQDHDLPGVTQANEAARIISKAAKSVKVIDPFLDREMPEKGGPDVSDFIKMCVQDEGMDADQIKERLCMMIENTAEWRDNSLNISRNLFVVKSGEEWLKTAKQTVVPKMLFGEFWFENELCILFADTNVGKSILAVQIADAISRGGVFAKAQHVSAGESSSVESSALTNVRAFAVEAPAQKVVYFDFELTVKQFESRFAERVEGSDHYQKHYEFHPNFLRAEINPETSELHGFSSFEDFLNHSLDATIVASGAKVLIIDNLTYLRDETENARNALPLMKYLKELKSKHGLSILTLAHTPKRDSSKPIGRNDLQGSKMLINFCDSSFAIGESHKDPGLRYLKQIKSRNTEIIYNSENVLLANIRKVDNFLGFHFLGYGSEHEHLKMRPEKDKESLVGKVKELAADGKIYKEIAAELGISIASVSRYLKSEA